jgi:hypothetical protein
MRAAVESAGYLVALQHEKLILRRAEKNHKVKGLSLEATQDQTADSCVSRLFDSFEDSSLHRKGETCGVL